MCEKISLFVPGRLCLFGEHSDWAGFQRVMNSDITPGISIVTGIEQGIHAEVEKSNKFIMSNVSEELKDTWEDFECPMQSVELQRTASMNVFFSYVAGVALYIKENYNVGGLKVTITKMTLPMKSGLSSSAAICVLVTRAFNLLYGLNLNTMGEMSVAFYGEQKTLSRCGRLDQACAFGMIPICMTFDGQEIDVRRITIKHPLYWVFAHLNSQKDTIRILSDLNKCYPFADSKMEQKVHEALGVDNQLLVERAIKYMEEGDIEALGSLMTEAQALFDEKVVPASFAELKAPKLHSILEDVTVKSLTFGGKGVGSQGDGSVQFLTKNEECQQELVDYLNSLGLTSFSLTIKPCNRIHKAMIPIAGFGTRLYPFTRFIKKEFIPIVDFDGVVKPVILVLLEQLYDSGIDEICLIVGSYEDIAMYKKLFMTPISDEHLSKLCNKMRDYENKILKIGKLLFFRVQEEKRGFGDAVFQARDFCNEESVLLLLGDTIYRSSCFKTCSTQLIEAYERLNCPVIAIHKIFINQVPQYGIVSGIWENKEETLLRIKNFVEKPSTEYAEDFLSMTGKNKEQIYYSVFGQYVLTPKVFEELEVNIMTRNSSDKSGEYGLTEALAALINKCGLTGVVLEGEMFDVGNSAAYNETMSRFQLSN